MKVYTLWHQGDGNDAPWIVDAVDEYTLYNHGERPSPYVAKLADPNVRELVIDIPEDAVRALFGATQVKACPTRS